MLKSLLLLIVATGPAVAQPILPDTAATVAVLTDAPFPKEKTATLLLLQTTSAAQNTLAVSQVYLPPSTSEQKKTSALKSLLVGELVIGAVSATGFVKNGAYWTGAAVQTMSLGSFNGGRWSKNDQTYILLFGLLHTFALHHYFVEPSQGKPVFWRSFAGLNAVALTTFLGDKAFTYKKKRRERKG